MYENNECLAKFYVNPSKRQDRNSRWTNVCISIFFSSHSDISSLSTFFFPQLSILPASYLSAFSSTLVYPPSSFLTYLSFSPDSSECMRRTSSKSYFRQFLSSYPPCQCSRQNTVDDMWLEVMGSDIKPTGSSGLQGWDVDNVFMILLVQNLLTTHGDRPVCVYPTWHAPYPTDTLQPAIRLDTGYSF